MYFPEFSNNSFLNSILILDNIDHFNLPFNLFKFDTFSSNLNVLLFRSSKI